MEVITAYVIRRIDGVYVNAKFEPVRGIRAACRFSNIEDYHAFMQGYYKPDHPEDYFPQPIKITYEEDDNGRAGDHEEAPRTVPA